MSRFRELVEEFIAKYEEPEIDELTVGFSSIDPPLRVSAEDFDHEELSGLLGGNIEGHYHLTKDIWQQITAVLDLRDYDGGYANTTDAEYELNEDYWMDGGGAGW